MDFKPISQPKFICTKNAYSCSFLTIFNHTLWFQVLLCHLWSHFHIKSSCPWKFNLSMFTSTRNVYFCLCLIRFVILYKLILISIMKSHSLILSHAHKNFIKNFTQNCVFLRENYHICTILFSFLIFSLIFVSITKTQSVWH